MQWPMIFFIAEQDYLNLVIAKWTAINMMQENETVDKNRWYLDSVLYCLCSYFMYGLFIACDVNKRHFLHGMYLLPESLQPSLLDAGRVYSRHRRVWGPTDICVETLCWRPTCTWGPGLRFFFNLPLTTEFMILLYSSATKQFTVILLNCKNTG